MNSFWLYIGFISVFLLLLGVFIGWTGRGDYNKEEIGRISRELERVSNEKFNYSISWAINNHLLIVNTNKLRELELNLESEK